MTTQESFVCVLCKESFEDKETLQIHFRKHSDPAFNNQPKKSSPRECEESKESDAKVDLVSCDVCPEVFPTISKAITHKHKVHPEHDAKYFCHWCGKLFTLMHLFNKHLTSHAAMLQGDEKFHCDCCNVYFYVPSAMLYHNKFFHRQDTDLPFVGHSNKQKFVNKELMQLYYCPFCGEEYINKVNLHKHMRDEHGDENQSPEDVLRCPLCEAVFHHLDAYEVHLTFHDSNDIYNGKDDDMRKEDISEFTLDTVPPIMEKVENAEPEEGEQAAGLDELLQLAMNEDSNVSGKKKHKKHKKHKKSKKETITLDEFLNMNTDVFGDGLDFQVHGVEEVPSKAVKRLSVKPQKVLKSVSKVVATPELERLKKQGIVIKNVNKPRLAPGIKIKGSPPMGSLKVANNVSTKAIVTTKTPQTSQTPLKASNEEVLSKLLSQSQNQIVISKKSQNSNQTSQENTGSPTVNVFGSGVTTPEDIEVQCDVRMTSSSELGEDDRIDPNTSKPVLEHEATYDKEVSEKNYSATQDKAPELPDHENKEIETKHDTDDDINDNRNNTSEKLVKLEVNSNANILKGISQHITVKSLSQSKPASPVNSSPKRVETLKSQEVCKQAENNGQAEKKSKEVINASPKKAPLDVLKNLGHLTIKSSQKAPLPTVSELKDKEDFVKQMVNPQQTQETDKEKTEQNKSIEVLKKISPNITVKQAAHKQGSEGHDSDVDEHFDFDDELDEHQSDHDSEHEADDIKSQDIPANTNISTASAALKNIGQGITIKPTNPSKSNGKDGPSNNTPPPLQKNKQSEPNDAIKKFSSQLTVKSINRPPVNRVLPKKETTNDDDIVSIDDSDSDDIESKAKTRTNNLTLANASRSIPSQKVAQAGPTAPPRPVVKQPAQNIIVKKETTVSEHNPVTDNEEFDAEEDIKPNVITKPVISNVAQKLLNNKNLSLKNMNIVPNKKPQSPNRMNSPQNSPSNHSANPVVETQIVKYKPREHISDYDSDGGDFPDDFSNHSDDGIRESENDINKNMKEFNFDSDEHPFSDDNDDKTCGSNSQSLIDKLKNINQNLSIKSSNQNKKVVASASSYQNISKNVTIKSANDNKRQVMQKQVNCMKRESSQFLTENDDDDEDAATTPSKQHKVAEQSRELVKHASMAVQRAPRPGPACRQVSQAASTVNQQVTTSVKTIQSETVVEEITTTVTRTIKTINREVSMTGNQTISKVNVAPNIVQGARPRLSPSLQGVAVRQAAPFQARPRMRPTRPVVNTNVRVPSQVLPARPSNQMRPTTPRMPVKVRTVTPNQQTRPIKIAQNVQKALTKVNRAPAMDPPGHFSCFKKPKESLIPMDSSDDEFMGDMPAPSSLQSPKMNIAGSSKSMQSQSVVEMTSSHQQISKLSTVSGLKIVKSSSQSKQVVNKVEKCEVGGNRTLEAIQRLQKQGLLVKKPRLEEPDEGTGLLAIEDAPH